MTDKEKLGLVINALKDIKATCRVCKNFEICSHEECSTIYSIWCLADEVLCEIHCAKPCNQETWDD